MRRKGDAERGGFRAIFRRPGHGRPGVCAPPAKSLPAMPREGSVILASGIGGVKSHQDDPSEKGRSPGNGRRQSARNCWRLWSSKRPSGAPRIASVHQNPSCLNRKMPGRLRHRDKRKCRVGVGVPWETWTRAQKRGCWEVAPGLTVRCLISAIIGHGKSNAGGVFGGVSLHRVFPEFEPD